MNALCDCTFCYFEMWNPFAIPCLSGSACKGDLYASPRKGSAIRIHLADW